MGAPLFPQYLLHENREFETWLRAPPIAHLDLAPRILSLESDQFLALARLC